MNRSPIAFDCQASFQSSGKLVLSGPYPLEDGRPKNLLGKQVEVDGTLYTVHGVEAFSIGRPYPRGMTIGLIVESGADGLPHKGLRPFGNA